MMREGRRVRGSGAGRSRAGIRKEAAVAADDGSLRFVELPLRPAQEARNPPVVDALQSWGLAPFAHLPLLRVDPRLCTQIYRNFDPLSQQSLISVVGKDGTERSVSLSFRVSDIARALCLPEEGYCDPYSGMWSVVRRDLFPGGVSNYHTHESAWKISAMTTAAPVKAVQYLVQYVDLSHQGTYIRNRTADLLAEYEKSGAKINWAMHVQLNLLHNRSYGLMSSGSPKQSSISLRTGHLLMRILADQASIEFESAEPAGSVPRIRVKRKVREGERGGRTEEEAAAAAAMGIEQPLDETDRGDEAAPTEAVKAEAVKVEAVKAEVVKVEAVKAEDYITEAMRKLQAQVLSSCEEVSLAHKLVCRFSSLDSTIDPPSVDSLKAEVRRLTSLYLSAQRAKSEAQQETVKLQERLSIRDAQIDDRASHISALTDIVAQQKAAISDLAERIVQNATHKSSTDMRIESLQSRIRTLQESNGEFLKRIETQNECKPDPPAASSATSDLTQRHDPVSSDAAVKEESNAILRQRIKQLKSQIAEEQQKQRKKFAELDVSLALNSPETKRRVEAMSDCYQEALSKLPLPLTVDNRFEVDYCALKAFYSARFGEWTEKWDRTHFNYIVSAIQEDKRLRQVLCLAIATNRVVLSETAHPILPFPCPSSIIASYLSEALLHLAGQAEHRKAELKRHNIGQIVPNIFQSVPKELVFDGGAMHAAALARCMAMQDEGVVSLAPNWNKADRLLSHSENVESPVNVQSIGKMMLEAHLFWKEAEEKGSSIIPGTLSTHYLDSFQFSEPTIADWNLVRSRLFKKRTKELSEPRKG